MSEPDSTKNPEQPQEPADPLKVGEVLAYELARLRPTFKSTVPAPVARKPETEDEEEEVPPALARELFEHGLTALCLSGGGIRSASFCLGILQALVQRKLLSHFDYLSTVSGGGYIGSWLSAWRTREGQNIAKVEESLAGNPEPKEVTSLRDFTSYLTPRRGLMSSDTWASFATVIRNLVLNWTLFLPLLLLLVWIPKFIVLVFQWSPTGPSSPAFWLITAAVLYFLSELFISWQIIKAEQQPGIVPKEQQRNSDKPLTYGAGQTGYLFLGLFPAYAAACLALVVLVRALPAGDDCWAFVSRFAGQFACVGAFLWGLPFLLAAVGVPLFNAPRGSPFLITSRKRWKRDYVWLVVARALSGAFFGVALVLAVALLRWVELQYGDRYVVVFGISGFFLAHLAGSILFAGLSTLVPDFDAVREWTARAGGWFLVSGLVWTVYAFLVLSDLPEGWSGKLVHLLIASGGTFAGVASALFGHSPSTPAREGQKSSSNGLNWNGVAAAGAVFFSVVAVFELSRAFDWAVLPDSLASLTKSHKLTSSDSCIPLGLIAPAFLVVWAVAASLIINVNKFSLHTYYRNRLIRCYLGASNNDRRPNAFTGFDEGDNRKMSKLPRGKPFHVINITLNLAHGKRLAWQERKATSFTVSPLAVGNPHVRYRRAEKYGDEISLGTAMAISGAAASPNMGYHSSPPLALLMTLFNVRLGWWLGNPTHGAWNISGPRLAILPFIMELFGLTDDERRFVYLSDGGHFENLGIYEMLRRRCRTIVAIDGACDPKFEFEDLGNLIRKARIDFGAEVCFSQPFTPSPNRIATRLGLITSPKTPTPSPYCAIGRIRYPGISAEGTLIYVKAAIHGDEPEDTLSYAATCETFPHESTLDQFFTESKFESYRRLGLHIGSAVFGRQHEDSLEAVDELVKLAAEHVQARSGAAAT
jgi:Patatin-like phospholipase